MIRLFACLCALSLSTAALAWGQVTGVMGWTADGRYLVYETVKEEMSISDTDGDDDGYLMVKHAVVVDTSNDQSESYILDFEQRGDMGFHADGPMKDAFDAWKKSNLLLQTPATRQGPGESGRVDATTCTGGQGTFVGTTFTLPPVEEESCVMLQIAHGGHTWRSAQKTLEPAGMYIPRYAVTWSWSPSGDQIAWFITRAEAQTMRGPVYAETDVILTAVRPFIEVLAHDALGGEREQRVSKALLEARLGAVINGRAIKERGASVVYAPENLKAAAKRIAEAVPGGATVEPLTWKANGDIVVAVGASVVP